LLNRDNVVAGGIRYIDKNLCQIFSWFGRRISHMGYENYPTIRQQWRILGNVRKYNLAI